MYQQEPTAIVQDLLEAARTAAANNAYINALSVRPDDGAGGIWGDPAIIAAAVGIEDPVLSDPAVMAVGFAAPQIQEPRRNLDDSDAAPFITASDSHRILDDSPIAAEDEKEVKSANAVADIRNECDILPEIEDAAVVAVGHTPLQIPDSARNPDNSHKALYNTCSDSRGGFDDAGCDTDAGGDGNEYNILPGFQFTSDRGNLDPTLMGHGVVDFDSSFRALPSPLQG